MNIFGCPVPFRWFVRCHRRPSFYKIQRERDRKREIGSNRKLECGDLRHIASQLGILLELKRYLYDPSGGKVQRKCAYMYPVRMFSNVDFPAPLGPIIAVNSPDLNSPDTPLSTVFCTVKETRQFANVQCAVQLSGKYAKFHLLSNHKSSWTQTKTIFNWFKFIELWYGVGICIVFQFIIQ